MLHTSRITILGLLLLMQLFAPLVHAHAGGGQSPGIVHVPGLEFLSKPNGTAAQPPADPAKSRDVIVGLAPGLKNQGGHAIPAPDPEFMLAVYLCLWAMLPQAADAAAPPLLASPPPAYWLAPPPRAPPARV